MSSEGGRGTTKVVQITHSTLDVQSSIIMGDDSDKVEGKVTTRFDSMYSTVNVLSTDGLAYIVDFINRNLKDSVRGDLIPRKYFLMINM